MATQVQPTEVSEVLRNEYEKLVQEREQLFQERARLFGLKPTVYVRNLDATTTEAELKSWFQQCGPIKECRLQLDKNGVSQCTAFIEFYYIASCDEACKKFHEQYRDKSAAQPLQVQLERKFQNAQQVYKSNGYRLEHAIPPQHQGFDKNQNFPLQQGRPQHTMQMPPFVPGSYNAGMYPPHPQQQMNRHHQPMQQGPPLAPGAPPQQHQQHQPQHQQQQQQQQQQQPNRTIIGQNGETNALFIANLRSEITKDTLAQVLGDFGQILESKVLQDKGYGFVTFADIASAKMALALNGVTHEVLSKRNTSLLVEFKGAKK